MFLAVSSLGKAMAYDYDYDYSGYESYDDDEPHFDYPQMPPPEPEDGGDCSYAYAEDIPRRRRRRKIAQAWSNVCRRAKSTSTDTMICLSSLGNAMSYGFDYSGFGFPDDDEPDFYYPQPPPLEPEDGGGCLLILRGITYEVGPQKICQCIEDLKMTFVESRIKQVYEKCECVIFTSTFPSPNTWTVQEVKAMDTVHEKLDEAMAEIQKLRADYKINAESSENFKRAYNKGLIKIRDASSNVDKLTLELSMKEDELSVGKQAYEELKSNLKDKEAAIKSLSSANGRLRADYAEKLKKFEEENRSMAVELDETNAANMEQEQQIQTLRNEIDKLNTNLES
nr:uncharacterized protein At4g38062-like [Ipomoea trifida]